MLIATFTSRLAALRAKDATLDEFGAYMHQYRLGPVLEEAQVGEFEAQFGIRLPDDLRAFITKIGNGGAGPGYGLNRLGLLAVPQKPKRRFASFLRRRSVPEAIVYEAGKTRYPIEHYRQAFPHLYFDTIAELASSPALVGQPSPLHEPVWEPTDEEWQLYLKGALTLAHYGCGLTARLLLSGPAENTVWVFDDCDRAAITPFAEFAPTLGGPAVKRRSFTFSSWYDYWLIAAGV